MEYKTGVLRREFAWLLASATLAFLAAGVLFGWPFLSGTIDLHFHDTYFVFSGWHILTPFLLLTLFVVYFIRQSRNSFNGRTGNWILIISGTVLILSLSFLINKFSVVVESGDGGWSAYPGTGTVEKLQKQFPDFDANPIITFASNFLLVLQFLCLIVLLFAVYRIGKQKGFIKNG